jgi:hypothetical protein
MEAVERPISREALGVSLMGLEEKREVVDTDDDPNQESSFQLPGPDRRRGACSQEVDGVPHDDPEDRNRCVPSLKFSRGGALAAALFLFAAFAVFAWVFLAASKNQADTGESGILLLPFSMPWVTLLPGAWVGPLVALGCILLNSLVLYCLFGGLRITKSARRLHHP